MTAIRNNKQFSNKEITCNNNEQKIKICNKKQGKKQTCKDLVVHLLASIIDTPHQTCEVSIIMVLLCIVFPF